MTATHDASTPADAADDVARQLRASAAAEGHDDGPGAPGTADPDVVRTALATLPHDDQQLLWDLHVVGRRVDVVAREMGVHARAAQRRLAEAEQRLAGALSASHVRGATQRLCMETRSGLREYVRHGLGAQRRQAFEDHLFGCSGCMRAFIDVRQASWALRDAAPVLLAGAAASGVAVPVVVGAAGASASSTVAPGWFAASGAAFAGAWEWLVRGFKQVFGRPVALAGGVGVAALAVAAAAMIGSAGGGTPDGGAPVAPVAAPEDSAVEAPSPTLVPSPTPEPTPSRSSSPEPSDSPPATPSAEPSTTPSPRQPAEVDPEPTPTAYLAEPREPAPTPEPEPEPSDPGTAEPTTAAEKPEKPVTPEPSATPPAPVAPPTPAPSPTAPASATVSLEIDPWGVFLVRPSDGAEVVAVGGSRSNVRVWQDHRGRWWAVTTGGSRGSVEVEVAGPAGSDPGARLSWWGRE